MHGIAIWFGLTNPAGRAYLFWSGVGGDMGYIAVPLLITEYLRRNTCDKPGCHRISRRKVKDTFGDTHSVCARHWPRNKEAADRLAEQLSQYDERPLAP